MFFEKTKKQKKTTDFMSKTKKKVKKDMASIKIIGRKTLTK